jgi:hypothetical protein
MTAGGLSRKIFMAELCGRAESIDTVECGSELHICTLYRELGLGVHIVSLLCRGRKGFVQREEGFQGGGVLLTKLLLVIASAVL